MRQAGASTLDQAGAASTRRLMLPAYCAAALILIVRLLTAGRYGYFRDELYFLACGEHLAWGYVDHAPLIGLIAWLSRALFGDSLYSLRLFPALASAGKFLLIGGIVRELGGRRTAVTLACLGWLAAPAFLNSDTRLSMNAFEPLFWMGSVYALLLVINRRNPRLWLWFGVLVGLGLENKHSTLFFLLAVIVGLLLTQPRRTLTDKWLWIAWAIAGFIFLPNLVWQWANHWPTLEHLSSVKRTHQNIELAALPFLTQQVRMLNVANILIWLPGLWFLLADREGKRYRALGWTYLAFLAAMMLLKGKDYYLTPIYPMLFAAGGVWWERLTATRFRWSLGVIAVLALALGCLKAPFELPILSPGTFLKYRAALNARPSRTETRQSGLLPQHFGDEFGWPEMVDAVSRIYHRLPPEQQAKTAIFTNNYGEAGAIDFFGPRHGLPKAISAHQTYYLWGPRDYTGESVIVLQWDRTKAERYFTSVQSETTLDPPYAMDEERYTIYLCTGMKRPLAEVWPELRH